MLRDWIGPLNRPNYVRHQLTFAGPETLNKHSKDHDKYCTKSYPAPCAQIMKMDTHNQRMVCLSNSGYMGTLC